MLQEAMARVDTIRGGHYVSLQIEDGQTELHAIHDALYGGVLAAHRRADVPFVPHLTVAASSERSECETVASELNARSRVVRGRIESVAVIQIREPTVLTVATIPLGT
jgi:hypothetical protein